MTKVRIWGMDSWSGRELIEELEFKDLEEAKAYVSKYNSVNNEKSVPEYYQYAEIV